MSLLIAPYRRPEGAKLVADEYIVILKDDYTLKEHLNYIGVDLTTFDSFNELGAINGYHARLDDHTIHNLIRTDPDVAHVEHESLIRPVHSTPSDKSFSGQNTSFRQTSLERRWSTAKDPLVEWPSRMMTGGEKLDLSKDLEAGEFLMDSGRGVNVYILDTGVRLTHRIFQGRARNLGGGKGSDVASTIDQMNEDFDGHGTHVAGIVMQNAPYANIVSIKVYGEGATFGELLQGFSWLESYDKIICVAACNRNYEKDPDSNYGSDVDFIAPGEDIWSASNMSDYGGVVHSGTSMAAPAVAAMLSIFISYESLANDTALARKRLDDNAVQNVVSGFGWWTPNKLANSGLHNPDKKELAPYKGAPLR
ncbi:MAG: hypothetical protein Q9227_002148 [Pyrenula ochraceoflavens]